MLRNKAILFGAFLIFNINIPLFCDIIGKLPPEYSQNTNVSLDVPAPPKYDTNLPIEEVSTVTIDVNNNSETVLRVKQKQNVVESTNEGSFFSKSSLNDVIAQSDVYFYYSIPKPPATTSNLLRIEAPGASDGSITGNNDAQTKTTWNYTIDSSNGSSKLAVVVTQDKEENQLYSWGKTKNHDGTFTFKRETDKTETKRKNPFNQFQEVTLADNGIVRVRLASVPLGPISGPFYILQGEEFSNPWVNGDSLSKPLSEDELKMITSSLKSNSLIKESNTPIKSREKTAGLNLPVEK
jgi:hypothetical protein